MSDKIKACCENCDDRKTCLFKNWELCSQYKGVGLTPDQYVAELEAENAKLREYYKKLARKEGFTDEELKFHSEIMADHITDIGKMVDGREIDFGSIDIRKLVKPIFWEDYVGKKSFRGYIGFARVCYFKVNIDDYQTDIYFCIKDGKKRSSIPLLCAPKMLYRAACQWCQDWLVSLVANACGSEVRNENH